MVPPRTGGPAVAGHSYDGLLVRARRATVVALLRQLRFTGWVSPQEGCWVVVVAAVTRGAVAGHGRRLDHLGAELAAELATDLAAGRTAPPAAAPAGAVGTVVLAVSVRGDRALALAGWDGGEEVGRYASDRAATGLAFPVAAGPALDRPNTLADDADPGRPSGEPQLEDDEDEEDEGPLGVEHAAAFAQALGRPEAGEALGEVLADVLDPEEEIESERLVAVFDLFGLPRWLVAARSLPRDVPGGPRASQLLRLYAGREGVGGQALGWATAPIRRRRRSHS